MIILCRLEDQSAQSLTEKLPRTPPAPTDRTNLYSPAAARSPVERTNSGVPAGVWSERVQRADGFQLFCHADARQPS